MLLIDWFFVKSSTPPTSIILRLNCHRKGVKYHYDIKFNFKRLAQEKFIRVDLTIMSPPVYRRYFFVLDVCLSVRLSAHPFVRSKSCPLHISISPKQFKIVEGFSWNLCQMFTPWRRCAEPTFRPYRFKVKVRLVGQMAGSGDFCIGIPIHYYLLFLFLLFLLLLLFFLVRFLSARFLGDGWRDCFETSHKDGAILRGVRSTVGMLKMHVIWLHFAFFKCPEAIVLYRNIK